MSARDEGCTRGPTKARLQKLLHEELAARNQHESWSQRQTFIPNDPYVRKQVNRAYRYWQVRKRRLEEALELPQPAEMQVEMKL